ncbi:hypothetical protein BRARA_G03385 [Brassica rapa]|uniref:Pectinesterase inhibitor domain-containing protein n=1 Tax=Brassica campestris TaxID=3711 RepID=A0A397YRY4_BRACM|nr:hypothetical protein BRARA_G03385 [Brassica rapa]VDD02196.1 unnamed protein product [Brassica rapa]
MAKFASIVALLFAALVLFAAFEAPTMVEAVQKLCERPSGTCQESVETIMHARISAFD